MTVRRFKVVEFAAAVESACTGCGTIFAPDFLAKERFSADTNEMLKVLTQRRYERTRLQDVVGKSGNFKALGLPSWLDRVEDAQLLFENARDQGLQNQRPELRLTRLRHVLGLTPDHPELIVPTIAGNVVLSENLARHLASKSDSGHNQLAHLSVQSLLSPREVWDDGTKQRFLALYRIGDSFATHMVVVSSEDRYVHTVYEIDDSRPPDREDQRTRDSIEDRTNAKRDGACIHVGYLTKP